MTFNKPFLTNTLVLTGLLFTTARMIRGTDNLYFLALLSFLGIWALDYKIIWDPKFQRIIIWFLPFGIWAIFTSIWSLEPIISFTRGLFYIFISSTAVLVGFLFRHKLNELFKIFLILNVFVVLISFLSLISGIPSDAWTANHGMGFTSIFTHQNSLAAVLMFTLIGSVYFLVEKMDLVKSEKHALSQTEVAKGKSENLPDLRQKASGKSTVIPEWFNRESIKGTVIPARLKPESIFCFLLLISNLYLIYLSYSRSVMLALLIGGITLFYLLSSFKTNIIFTVLVVILGMSVYFLFQESVTQYLKKGGKDYFARRAILWEPSYNAALHGGFFGLGYGVTDPLVESTYKKENKFGEFKREKGNSVLALVEEAGIIGLILFLMPVAKIAKLYLSSYKKSVISEQLSDKINPSLLSRHGGQAHHQSLITSHSSLGPFPFLLFTFAFLLSFFVHSQFEAWWTGISSIGLLIFIVLLSILFQTHNTKE